MGILRGVYWGNYVEFIGMKIHDNLTKISMRFNKYFY